MGFANLSLLAGETILVISPKFGHTDIFNLIDLHFQCFTFVTWFCWCFNAENTKTIRRSITRLLSKGKYSKLLVL